MTHASVFSGIGGPEVAATMLGWQNLFHCEINPFGRKVLDYWFPDSKSYEDITKTDFTEWRGKVNVLTGGFPCQPFSFAGKRRGADDDRYLWPHMHRCINEIKPDWFIGENVAGILTMVEQGDISEVASETSLFGSEDCIHRYEYHGTFTLERICRDVEADGYEVFPILIPACAVGAPHRRDRVFIVGRKSATDTTDTRAEGVRQKRENAVSGFGAIADTNGHRGSEMDKHMESELADGAKPVSTRRERYASDTDSDRHSAQASDQEIKRCGWSDNGKQGQRSKQTKRTERLYKFLRNKGKGNIAGCGRWTIFPSVSPVHRGNDGIPFDVDSLAISFPKWRNESIKAYGNAIVPQVMYEIFRAIEQVNNLET